MADAQQAMDEDPRSGAGLFFGRRADGCRSWIWVARHRIRRRDAVSARGVRVRVRNDNCNGTSSTRGVRFRPIALARRRRMGHPPLRLRVAHAGNADYQRPERNATDGDA
ncbi:hypothetical protein PAGU2638_07620 [Lysobacter sp. PAGU 2638]